MYLEDIKSLSEKTREDGKRLFGVSELIYKIAIIGISLIGIVGWIAALFAMQEVGFWFGFSIAFFTFLVCFISYIIAVLTTHVAKVLVHTSFSNVAILEYLTIKAEG